MVEVCGTGQSWGRRGGRGDREVVRVSHGVRVRGGIDSVGAHKGDRFNDFAVGKSSPITVNHGEGGVAQVVDISVVLALRIRVDRRGAAVDHEVCQVAEVEGVVGRIEVIASGSKFGDFQISNMSDRVAGGRGIVHSAADHSDSFNDLIVREEVAPVQVRDGEDRLIIREDVSVTVGLFLLGRGDGNGTGFHE